MHNPDRDPRAEGMEAAHCGKPESANPYDLDTHPDEHMAWNDGWADTDEDE